MTFVPGMGRCLMHVMQAHHVRLKSFSFCPPPPIFFKLHYFFQIFDLCQVHFQTGSPQTGIYFLFCQRSFPSPFSSGRTARIWKTTESLSGTPADWHPPTATSSLFLAPDKCMRQSRVMTWGAQLRHPSPAGYGYVFALLCFAFELSQRIFSGQCQALN